MEPVIRATAARAHVALEAIQDVAGRVPARAGCPWAPELRDALAAALRAGATVAAVARVGGVGRVRLTTLARELGVEGHDRGRPGPPTPCGVVVWRDGQRYPVGADLHGQPAPLSAEAALTLARRLARWDGVERVEVVDTRWAVEFAERVVSEEEQAALEAAERSAS